MSDFYNREGVPISLDEFAVFTEDLTYKRVRHDYIGDFMISTAWMGIDHSFGSEGPILIFETMIFAVDSYTGGIEDFDHYQKRYTTEEEAKAGHEEAIQVVLNRIRIFTNDHTN